MIARILYRESVHGVLNYVLDKPNAKILGFQNVAPQLENFPNLFKHHLHYLGNRHHTQKRYVHIMLNLPHGEFVSDKTFLKIASEYMGQMGYAGQPFAVVRHDDTKHEHVHIVTTRVRADNSLVNLSNDYARNVATQKYLERKFGLLPSPEVKSPRELPVLRIPENQPLPDDSKGVKFYIQDILNTMVQCHKLRSFDELAQVLEPYHILVHTKENTNGRVGISYGIAVNTNGYKSRFINGYVVHPQLSGPKLQQLFLRNNQSKLIPMHRKRLEKQLLTTLKLFKNIGLDDLPNVLQSNQKLEVKPINSSKGVLEDLMIYDKSGYVFRTSEIGFELNEKIKGQIKDEATQIDVESEQFQLEALKLIKGTLYKQYLELNQKDILPSAFILKQNFNAVLSDLQNSENYTFLESFLPEHAPSALMDLIQKEYHNARQQFYITEFNKEQKLLEDKTELLKTISRSHIFDLEKKEHLPFELIQSLGLKYGNGMVSFMNSSAHKCAFTFENFKLPNKNTSFISTGFINENDKILRYLVTDEKDPKLKTRASAFFLPKVFPELYKAMSWDYRAKFELESLGTYLKTAEKQQQEFEKSPSDYIRLLNAKGFYFEKKDEKLFVKSIYTQDHIALELPKQTQSYLKSEKGLDELLMAQKNTTANLETNGLNKLENLWLSYLIERELYDKAAFIIVMDGIRPNMATDVFEHHMEHGLKDKILETSKQKLNFQHKMFLRKSVYAFSSLMGKHNSNTEVFNGFKDELTDYSKHKNVFF